ncbi:MAG: hypothetical protein ACYSTF_02540 [Planctomycetota bacterium]
MALWTKATLCVKSSLLEQSLPGTPTRPIRSLPTYQVSLWSLPTYKVGQCNPWLIKDLRAYKVLYNCRETFTDVMSALQIAPICTNKPNFRKSQMNVSDYITTDYDKMDTWSIRKNKPNSKPIQTQFKPNQSQNKPNTNPKQTQFHMILAYFSSRAKKLKGQLKSV